MHSAVNFRTRNWKIFSLRVLLIFFTLKIATSPNFWSYVIVRDDFAVWTFFDRLTPFYLWLNKKLFHFSYQAYGWTAFTAPLKIIQSMVCLFVAVIGSAVWTWSGASGTKVTTDYWLYRLLSIALSLSLFNYGIVKLIPVQMPSPSWVTLNTRLGDLTPFDLWWASLGYATSYQVFTGFLEILASLLLLFRRTALVGAILSFFLLLNIIVTNYAFSIGVLHFSFLLFMMDVVLLLPYWTPMYRFFIMHKRVVLQRDLHPFNARWKKIALTVLVAVIVLISFASETYRAITWKNARKEVARSRKIYRADTFMIDGNMIPKIEDDSTRWAFVTESESKQAKTVTITRMNLQVESYSLSAYESGKNQMRLIRKNSGDSIVLQWNAHDISKSRIGIETQIKGHRINAELVRILPDTAMELLKASPSFWQQ